MGGYKIEFLSNIYSLMAVSEISLDWRIDETSIVTWLNSPSSFIPINDTISCIKITVYFNFSNGNHSLTVTHSLKSRLRSF